MDSTKGKQQQGEIDDETPPSYDEALQTGSQEPSVTTDLKHPPSELHDATSTKGTPSNFPSSSVSPVTNQHGSMSSSAAGPSTSRREQTDYSSLPEVVIPPEHSKSRNTPPSLILAIPQTAPQPTSPFLQAYSTAFLLSRGIPSEAFTSFLSTLSAFLSATVSERALAHVSDVGRNLNDIPKKFSRDTVDHVKQIGRHVGNSAREGKLVTTGYRALAGTVSIPVTAALRIVDATVRQLPTAVGSGFSRKPPSPRERAEAYVTITQKDWFQARGLVAFLCDTAELIRHVRRRDSNDSGPTNEATVDHLVNLTHSTWEKGLDGQLLALQQHFGFAPLEITNERSDKREPLHIRAGTLWLVVIDAPSGA
ncbi:hypothetical protein F4861DRAFT_5023 [Xylaria intraflava]|nr:hypothetical protein F4861DRAFT_5023 [Xylaria intraflava]